MTGFGTFSFDVFQVFHSASTEMRMLEFPILNFAGEIGMDHVIHLVETIHYLRPNEFTLSFLFSFALLQLHRELTIQLAHKTLPVIMLKVLGQNAARERYRIGDTE